MKKPTCPYCQSKAKLVTGNNIFPHRKDLSDMYFWSCKPCGARVGCHSGTKIPLGHLANLELRVARANAHAAFDPLWAGSRFKLRKAAYAWLAAQLDVTDKQCHIGKFDVQQCITVVRICNEERKVK